jgi:hypothetical protein
MVCKVCGAEAVSALSLCRHLRKKHEMVVGDYLEAYPDQRADYELNRKPAWNKGLTKESSASVRKYSKKLKEICNSAQVRQERSNRLKKRYENGDILDKETRSRVARAGSDGWVKKISRCNEAERGELLRHFTSAGNAAQEVLRQSLRASDYQKLYPWGLGTAIDSHCAWCGKFRVRWEGGSTSRPRPKLVFCDKECHGKYKADHPGYGLGGKRIPYFSTKMNTEFGLQSRLELHVATLLDESSKVGCWQYTPVCIPYNWSGRDRKYYPDFLVNEKVVLEVKSDYVFGVDSGKSAAKIAQATRWCKENGLVFEYWEFGIRIPTLDKVKSDPRVQQFLF